MVIERGASAPAFLLSFLNFNSMPNTTAKRGRPATKKPVASQGTPSIKREIKKNLAVEFKTTRPMGAVFMMHQRGLTVFDEEKNIVREIRYCPNEPSPWRDEQSESATRKSIIFQEGRLFVNHNQPNLLEYMLLHPGNTANGGSLFGAVNKEKKAEIKVDKEFMMADAITMVRDKDMDELLSVAVAASIDIDRPVSEIKHDLLVYAKRNPENFIKSFDNPSVTMKTKVLMAAKYQVIKTTESGIYWTDSGKQILSVPAGKNPVDVFVRYCLTESAVPVVEEMDKHMGN